MTIGEKLKALTNHIFKISIMVIGLSFIFEFESIKLIHVFGILILIAGFRL